jgi:hypothetical protein
MIDLAELQHELGDIGVFRRCGCYPALGRYIGDCLTHQAMGSQGVQNEVYHISLLVLVATALLSERSVRVDGNSADDDAADLALCMPILHLMRRVIQEQENNVRMFGTVVTILYFVSLARWCRSHSLSSRQSSFTLF